jgi:hypothetical protein
MAETSTTKERLTREKHANYLVYALCNIGASIMVQRHLLTSPPKKAGKQNFC